MTAFENFVMAWITLADGLVRVATFGFVRPSWQFLYCLHCNMRMANKIATGEVADE